MRGFVHAAWGPRASSFEESARLLWACLGALGSESDVFRSWFDRSTARKVGEPIASAKELEVLLHRGQQRRDDDAAVIRSLGSVVGLWNGQQRDAGVLATVGSTAAIIPYENSFELDLPPAREASSLYEIGKAMRLVRVMIDVWSPDRVVFSSQAWRNTQTARDSAGEVGWLTYVRAQSGELSGVPSVATEAGRIYQLGESLEDVDEEALAAWWNRVQL